MTLTDMTREQYIRLEISNFVHDKFYHVDPKEKPIDVTAFIAYVQPLVLGFDEEVRRYIAELPSDEVEPAEREALYTKHVYAVEMLCRKVDTLEKLSMCLQMRAKRSGTINDGLLMLRIFSLMGAIRGELQAMERLML